MSAIVHGTDAGWSRCRQLTEGPCPECKQRRATYQRTRRATKVPAYQSELDMKAARTRAWKRLAQMHPTVYRDLLVEELQRRQEAA